MPVWNKWQQKFRQHVVLLRIGRRMRNALYSPVNLRLRERMKQARLDAGITQADLAEATGRNQAYISKFEAGQLRLDVDDFVIFAKCLGLDAHSLLDELMTEESPR